MATTNETASNSDRLTLWQTLAACAVCAILGALAAAGVTSIAISSSIGERVERTLKEHADRHIDRINDAGSRAESRARQLANEAGAIVARFEQIALSNTDRLATEIAQLTNSAGSLGQDFDELRLMVEATRRELRESDRRAEQATAALDRDLKAVRDHASELAAEMRQVKRDGTARAEQIKSLLDQLSIHRGMLDVLYAERKLAAERQ